MSYEQVDVYLEKHATQEAISFVTVRVYDTTGTSLFAEGVTDSDGRVGFLLPGDQSYTLRFYRFGFAFKQPLHFDVLTDTALPEGTTPNSFVAYGSEVDAGTSPDARLCRVSGYVRDVSGAPRPGLTIHFIGKFSPLIADGALVMSERRSVISGSGGFVCVDLFRCACYSVQMENFEDTLVDIAVPETASANLADVLFPIVDEVIQADIEVALNGLIELEPDVLTTSGVPILGTAQNDVLWEVVDTTIASVEVQQKKLIVRGLSPGVTTLKATRKNRSIVRLPSEPIQGQPIQITVTA